ncbi:MAG TPA: M14 family zinc carboxypeptidase, partial [Candidatus Krumholzibacterium sp.]|nr:M14 family zinc carboxypeptidase [Candidatus Krumholzibacterium sp.]
MERSTALVRTSLSKEITLEELARRNVDVLAVYPDGRVDLAVTERQLDWLIPRAPGAEVVRPSVQKAPGALDANLGLYHTYDEMNAMIDSLHALYPALTRLDTLGLSIEGRLIRAIKISDNPGMDETEPEVFLMGCHHAREIMTVEIALMMAAYLLDNYGVSAEITSLVDGREIWIAPMINPDGHVYVQNNHADDWWQWWRKNRRDNGDGTFGVDLNRNYGYQWAYDDVGSDPDPGAWTY